jgi:hypothetical protein
LAAEAAIRAMVAAMRREVEKRMLVVSEGGRVGEASGEKREGEREKEEREKKQPVLRVVGESWRERCWIWGNGLEGGSGILLLLYLSRNFRGYAEFEYWLPSV